MSIAPAAPISRQELHRIEDEGGVEFVNGQIVEKLASIESSEIEITIGRLLGNEAVKTGSARVFGATMGYQCFPEEPARFRKPDVSVVRSERLKGINPRQGLMKIPADLAIEVISPKDLAYAIDDKVEEYLRNGFRLIWIVHPTTRSVHVHRADGTVSVLHDQDEITGETALPSFKCKVADFFAA